MRYKISYEDNSKFITDKQYFSFYKNGKPMILGFVAIAVIGMLLVGAAYGWLQFDKTLVAKQALNNMASNLKNGDSIGEAIDAFCGEIFNDNGSKG